MGIITAISKPDRVSEYLTWKQSVEQNSGSFEWNSLFIANNFMKQLRTKSYYSKIKYLMPILGKGINACMIPLINTLSTSNPINTNLVDGDFSQFSGVKGDGSTKSIGTGIKPSSFGVSSNGGLGFWVMSTANVGAWVMGVWDGSGQLYGMFLWTNNAQFWWGDANSPASTGAASVVGHYYGQRNTIDRRLYLNGSQIAISTQSTIISNIDSGITMDIIANGNGGGYTDARCGVAYFTDGTLTTDEISDFHLLLSQYLMSPSQKI